MQTSFTQLGYGHCKKTTMDTDALEAMKNEGNSLFQQKCFAEAVRVYSSVLDQLCDVDEEAAVRLETAVRLNRAWAWIQMPDNAPTLATAEQDCSIVIEKDSSCVKAFYRRALARERRGHWKLAMEDAVVIKRLEPGNPSIGPLVERLQQCSQEDEDLIPKFQQCTVNSGDKTIASENSGITLAGEAENAWRMLQADEKNLKRVYQTASKRMTRRQKDKKISRPTKGEISDKTDDLWESLRREEITTVAKAFPRSTKGVN